MACGDALGAGYGFGPPLGPDVPVTMSGGGPFEWEPGEWTDDTSMAIAIAEVAADGHDLLNPQAQNRVAARWSGWAQGANDVGSQTLAVLDAARQAAARRGQESPSVNKSLSTMTTKASVRLPIARASSPDRSPRHCDCFSCGDCSRRPAVLTLIRATPHWRSERCPARILVVWRLRVNPDATSTAVPRPAATLVSFATEHVPESARVAMWEEHNTASLVGLTCQVPQRQAFRAREVNLALPRLQLASVTASPHAVKRNRRQVADTPAGSLAVYFAVTGEALLSSGDRACTVRPGQVLIVDADRPFVRSFAHGLRELAVTVPYEAIDLDRKRTR